jgi:hypothetical protein
MKQGKHSVFRSAIYTWARVVSRSLNVQIVFSGQPCTDGRTIQMFPLPDELDKETEEAIIGIMDHEASHVKIGRAHV